MVERKRRTVNEVLSKARVDVKEIVNRPVSPITKIVTFSCMLMALIYSGYQGYGFVETMTFMMSVAIRQLFWQVTLLYYAGLFLSSHIELKLEL